MIKLAPIKELSMPIMRSFFGLGLGVFALASGILLEGGSLHTYLQFTPLLIVVGGSLGMCLMVFSPSEILHSVLFATGITPANKKSRHLAQHVFTVASKGLTYSGILGFIFGLIHVLSNLAWSQRIGAGMVVAVICPLYAVMAKFFVIEPMLASPTVRRAVAVHSRKMKHRAMLEPHSAGQNIRTDRSSPRSLRLIRRQDTH